MKEFDIITGAFSFTGKYLTKKILSKGKNIKTFTNKKIENNSIISVPYFFNNREKLKEEMIGCEYFYNTYWIRFPYKEINFDKAVENIRMLVEIAKEVKVKKFIHISITNASENSELPYFRGKGVVEKIIRESGLNYAIVRPAVIFGNEDILINNIAWLLRKFPIFMIMGNGQYKLQPIYVEDLADILINASETSENEIIDALGPEKFTYEDLVKLIATIINSKAIIIHFPAIFVYIMSKILGIILKDIMLTKDEIKGLMQNYLNSDALPLGKMKLSEWLINNKETIGKEYSSELKRHYKI